MNPDNLLIIRHMVDFGLVVLIWLVQLVIYPSLLHIASDRLVAWHRAYTFRMTWVVGPLMLVQLGLVGWGTYYFMDAAHWLSLVLVIACWVWTFGVSVPFHVKIELEQGGAVIIRRLVVTNWVRTVLWTLVLLVGLTG